MIYKEVPERNKKLAELLFNVFSTVGIHGKNDMPEDTLPSGVIKGSLEHLFFITLTVSIDYQRDATVLWNNSRITFEDSDTMYLFFPKQLGVTEFPKIVHDMQKHGLSKKPTRDAKIWQTIAATFLRKWDSNPLNFLESCQWNSQLILEHLRTANHISNGRYEADFPNLRGLKIGPLWVRMLKDNVGITRLSFLEKVPIPVDIHIARASITTGVVRGKFNGRLEDLFNDIREAWFDAVKGINIKDRSMIALDVDEPLWHLSKYGCSKNRNNDNGYCSVHGRCEAKDFCVKGKIRIEKNFIGIDT